MQPVPAQTITRRPAVVGAAEGSCVCASAGFIDTVSFFRISSTKATAVLRVHLTVHFVVDDHYGASPQAPTQATVSTRKQHVGSSLVLLVNAQPLAQRIQNRQRVLHVAGRAIAEANDMLALRLQRKVGVERGHAKHARRRHTQSRGDVSQDFFGKVSVFFLYRLEDGYQACRVAVVFVKDSTQLLKFLRCVRRQRFRSRVHSSLLLSG